MATIQPSSRKVIAAGPIVPKVLLTFRPRGLQRPCGRDPRAHVEIQFAAAQAGPPLLTDNNGNSRPVQAGSELATLQRKYGNAAPLPRPRPSSRPRVSSACSGANRPPAKEATKSPLRCRMKSQAGSVGSMMVPRRFSSGNSKGADEAANRLQTCPGVQHHLVHMLIPSQPGSTIAFARIVIGP